MNTNKKLNKNVGQPPPRVRGGALFLSMEQIKHYNITPTKHTNLKHTQQMRGGALRYYII